MKLPLRKVDVMNSMDPLVSIATDSEAQYKSEGRFTIPHGFKLLLDAEDEIIALVPHSQYKDWNHAETIVELLNWAAANYPYRHGDDDGPD